MQSRCKGTIQFYSLLLLIVLALAACVPGTTPDGTAPTGDDAPQSGGEVIVILPEEPANLNPYLAVAAIVEQVSDATVVGLSYVDADGEFQPELAESIPTVANGLLSEDYLTVTWKLRPGLLWSDGEPITSADIVCTWEAVTHPDSGAVVSTGMELIESIDTPDELTAVLTYSAVNPSYAVQFGDGIFPCHAIGAPEEMTSWEWNRNPVAAGPFVVSEWNAGSNIIMEANPNYYEEGKPYVSALIFQIVPDPGAQQAMMIQGEGDIHLWPGANKSAYDAQADGVASLQEVPGQWNMALRFNLSRPFDNDPGPEPPHFALGDLRVRQAIAHAIDYDTVNSITEGTAPAVSDFAYGWFRCDTERQYTFDIERAQALLEEAGFVDTDGDGIRECQGCQFGEDGQRLTLNMEGYTNFQPLVQLEEALVEMFRAVGIEGTIQNDDFSIIFGSFADGAPRMTGNFDMIIYDASLGIEPHATVRNRYHSSAIPSADNPAGGNFMRWINETADAAIERAGSTIDDIPLRQEAYCELADEIASDLPQINLFIYTEGYGASNRISGYKINIWESLTWDAESWQITE